MKSTDIVVIIILTSLLGACTYQVRPSDRPQIDLILESSEKILNSEEFNEVLGGMSAQDFDHSSDVEALKYDDGRAILERILSKPVNDVVCRRAKNPFNRSTNAWEGDGTPQLRCSFLGKRSNENWVGTIIHERAHAAGYLHKGNKRSGNQCTVPHVVGDLAVFLAERANGSASFPEDVCGKLSDAVHIL